MLQCINGKMKYKTNTNLETFIKKNETKHNMKKLILIDILT